MIRANLSEEKQALYVQLMIKSETESTDSGQIVFTITLRNGDKYIGIGATSAQARSAAVDKIWLNEEKLEAQK